MAEKGQTDRELVDTGTDKRPRGSGVRRKSRIFW